MEKELPKGWVETEIDNLFYLIYGKGLLTKDLIEDGYDVYGANGIIGKYSKYLYKYSKVIISCRGAGCGIIHRTKPFSYITSNSIIFDEISVKHINLDFIKYALESIDKDDVITGTAQPQITIQLLKNLQIPFPPLPEQHRIVGKLDTLYGHLDALKTRLDRIPQLLKDFRQKVLTQAVTGKLTEEWREGKELESVETLFDKIIEKRKKRYLFECKLAKQQGERKPTKVYLDELPEIEEIDVELPQQWMQTNIHFLSFVTKLAGFEYTDHFKISENGEIPVVRAQNVQMGRFEDKNRLYIEKKTSDFLTRSQLHGREILMVFIGAGTGNVCIAPQNERWHLAPNVAKIDIDGVDTKYIYFYLQSNLGICNVLSRIKATAQPSLSMETIREIVTLIPPFEEQQEVVRRVESLFAKANRIEASYQKLKEKIEQLPQALLAKAFRGELVAQLPTDGDAKDLLEQIKQAKAGLEKGGKGRKMKAEDGVRMVAEERARHGEK